MKLNDLQQFFLTAFYFHSDLHSICELFFFILRGEHGVEAMRNAACFCRSRLHFEGHLKGARSPFPKVLKTRPGLKKARLHF